MSRLHIPAIHLPNGRDLFRPLPFRPAEFKKILKSYAERSLLECLPEDCIALPERPDESYLRFLLENGIGTEQVVECGGREGNFAMDIVENENVMKQLKEAVSGMKEVSFYMHLEEERDIAQKLGVNATMHPDITRMFNKLYFLQRMSEDANIPAIKSVQVRSGRFADKTGKLLEKFGGKLFVRGNESIGGIQTFVIESRSDIEDVKRKISRNSRITRYFVFPFIKNGGSWNLQYFFDDNGYSLFGFSRQVLANGTEHKGNVGGTSETLPDNVALIAGKVADCLHEFGARGFIGIDLMKNGDGEEVYPVEINARKNSSTPLLTVFNRLKEKNLDRDIFFQSLSVEVPGGISFDSFVGKAGREQMFSEKLCSGYLPFHFSASRMTGKLDVAIYAESVDELKQLVVTLEESFS